MQALMLAAGMGKRLRSLTKDNTKCMLSIQGKTLIERAVESLLDAGITKMTIVVGYKGENLKKFLTSECTNPRLKEMEFVFIDNPDYDKTNNIYSLYLAKDVLKEDDTILLESDLIYDPKLVKTLVDSEKPNAVTVAKYEPWMDGTVIKINDNDSITGFYEKKDFNYNEIDEYYKTVNIYKFTKEFSEKQFLPFLRAQIEAYGTDEYYELVLKIISNLDRSDLKALDVSNFIWYEIDNQEDARVAEVLFAKGEKRIELLQHWYGGYWRVPKLLDYCYLVNPYYPPKAMAEKMHYSYDVLARSYPSCQNVQAMNASRLFGGVDQKYLVVGNGAAEIINDLGRILHGNMYNARTVFNEYNRCFKDCNINTYDESKNDFKFDVEEIKNNVRNNDVICIVNPDNPTGAFIEFEDMIDIIQECYRNYKWIIFDESFIDFADPEKRYTLIKDEILERYPNLIVVKSISKSYGVPGERLGVLATSNNQILKRMKEDLAVWNINSHGEYFLQIAPDFNKDYVKACNKIVEERNRFIAELRKLYIGTVYDSQANYVLIKLDGFNSTQLAARLADNNILIKDLRTKKSFDGEDFVRLAIRSQEDNDRLIEALKALVNDNDLHYLLKDKQRVR